MPCPDENALGEFARGGMHADGRATIVAHLDVCESCSEVVSELIRIFESAFDDDDEPPPPSLDQMETTLGEGPHARTDWPGDLRLPEGARLGRYVVLRAIGAGAMGIVYSAYDPQLDRKVALKLLRRNVGESIDGDGSQSGRNKRLLREAQALARLSHPGVITVHDVGTFEGQVFLAMEFVENGTLTSWLQAQPRRWREVLRVFRQAGEGLAAAHDAGLVHRDFKPDNVLIHADGRAVVTDFGLARPLSRTADHEDTIEASLVSGVLGTSASNSALSETLTRTGALVGTPAYMAPEQLDARACDAQSDQFGFCVALYEGLYGERPFAARDMIGLISAVFEGRVRPPAKGRTVPRWLRRAVLRGLRVAPAERHPDMRGLLLALRPPALGSWRGVATMGVLSAVAGAGAVAVSTGAAHEGPATFCDDVAAKLDGAWDDAARAKIRESFSATGLSFAEDTATRVTATLDTYGTQWVEAQTDACRSEAQGRESAPVVASRMTCLARRRGTLGAMARALGDADANTVMQAVEAAQMLPGLATCNDAGALGHGLPPVPDNEAEEVARVRSLADESLALRILGRVADARTKAEEAEALATTLDYGPVRAEAKMELATALYESGAVAPAEIAIHEALAAGVAQQHDEVVAQAAAELAHLEDSRGGQPVVIKRWAWLGLAALDALGGERPHLRAVLSTSLGSAQRHSGDLEGAIETLGEVLAIRERHWGVDHYSVAEPLSALGLAHARRGDHDESVRLIERARTVLHDTYGPLHPHYGALLQNLGTTHFVHGSYTEALEIYQESHRLLQQSLGSEHPSVAVLAYNVATSLAFIERYDEAMTHAERAQRLENQTHGARSIMAANSWALVGEIHLRAGRWSEAEQAIRRALEISAEVAPDDVRRRANYSSQLGLVLTRAGRLDEARAMLDQALVVQRKIVGDPSIEVAETMGRLALLDLAEDRLASARTRIDISVEQYESEDTDPHQHAEARFRRARILAAAGERKQARAEAERAHALYGRLGDQPSRLRALELWLDDERNAAG
ncbi:MAG: serine/threonine-protein kinase [Deltaproteobacteria bacterium]|nr:serine/threonine-protein kinase [Deltaproteobacteria bacterium]